MKASMGSLKRRRIGLINYSKNLWAKWMFRIITNYVMLIVILFVFLSFGSVLYFTNSSYSAWNFTSTGQIGDTIGGLTAPFIGLLNAILLFITIKRQEEQRKEDKFDQRFDRNVDLIRLKIDALTFTLKRVLPNDKVRNVPYNSNRSLVALSMLFDGDSPIIRRYRPIQSDWWNFIEGMRHILNESRDVLQLNFYSDLSDDKKVKNYQYVMRNMIYIIASLGNIKDFYDKYPSDPVVERFGLRHFLPLQAFCDGLTEFRPKTKGLQSYDYI